MTAANTGRRRPGRPAGSSDTRDRILASARELFASNGIDRTSIRAVAAGAGVDAALVHHYFGTKQQLFAAAIHLPIDPMTVLVPMRETPVDELGLRLPSVLLPIWDSEVGAGLIATMRALLTGADVSLARSFLQEIVVEEVGSRVDNPPGTGKIRAQFVASQLMGVVLARYIVGIEPFASLPAEQIAATIAPTLQRYLTGDLPDGSSG
ncbi:TetR/AcrR family transcriptional regulator [Mycobacterium montefiorense]|uniref:TetR family transcriptional regulator n=2 Tax=Mycobacterium montefiorense TaxID=154654 RepID=A0AA37PJA9_9MYCO|nr:TetR family transcriptional regulator [Mycobacterium montefiorense]MCV7428492.1 TetR/AcrR family transcriptional regulator [Mycobacterium montefiorense]GBG38647.1 TetR family transcriptional regulator [Mycobacterium montefiorense]GKU34475.1 TetR family transcriptional regulator [Mycobacterium montefiorense]GKU39096.1 TetR family transcriptional regulator [Mycobacterium montefiorense]GKU47866.1 TetR family transcriptional regulator [Mycobacterium montefiorense]